MQNVTQTRKIEYIPYLKVLACLFITNSHCRDIYPFYFLAVGGSWGNALFFIIAGYCVAYIHTPFYRWYLKRIKRIIPATLTVILLDVLFIENNSSLGIWLFVKYYVDKYWFVFAILLYYAFYYFIFRKGDIRVIYISVLLHVVGYALIYIFLLDKTFFSVEQEGFSPFKVYFYYGVLLIGGVIRIQTERIVGFLNLHREQMLKMLMVTILFSLMLWAIVYFVLFQLHRGYYMQFLAQASVLIFAVSCLIFMEMNASAITVPDTICGRIINTISDSTLEIYLVQVTVKDAISGAFFPLNLILFFTLAITGGIIFHHFIATIFPAR